MTLRVTLDTNTIDHRERIELACAGLAVELAYTSITDRETEGTKRATRDSTLVETGVWDESRWGRALWGSSLPESAVVGESLPGVTLPSADHSVLEAILAITASGGFPHRRTDPLTSAQRSQLRDAMVLDTHVRDRRDVLVSDDAKAYINHGRRERLEALCSTRILTVDEFCSAVAALVS